MADNAADIFSSTSVEVNHEDAARRSNVIWIARRPKNISASLARNSSVYTS